MPNFVINKETKKLLRCGFVDFESESTFDGEVEQSVYRCCILPIRIEEQDWYWNEGTEEFQETQP